MRYFLLLAFAAVALTSCHEYKKEEGGLEYIVISNGKGDLLKDGEIIKFHSAQYYRTGKVDSLLNDTRNRKAEFEKIDTTTIPRNYYRIFKQMRVGDSAIFRISSDSLISQNPGLLPPFIKKGHYLISKIKIIEVYKNEEEADAARHAEMTAMLDKQAKEDAVLAENDNRVIQEYLAKNKIKAEKTEHGVYVEILKPGTGSLLDTNTIATVDYTGRLLSGEVFDSSTDTSVNPAGKPIHVNLTSDPRLAMSVIRGWREGLMKLNKGAKARLFIPSGLGYGRQGAEPKIPKNAILVFDVEVVDTESKETALAKYEKEYAAWEEQMKSKEPKNKLEKMVQDKIKRGEKMEITEPAH
ncbi:MAG: FKBP-type peptidyl-prolyl cis-trans isomerase [Ferruginibacter sp.]|nr:FKBP-type peptidyl-prolyl cis-trans isomerase [Ferruginibacter sp.]